MALFTISDTHLSFGTNKPMDKFGNRWTDYTEQLEEGWRALISPEDTVVLAGDISWAMQLEEALPDLRFLDRLPGQKLISRGNHDYWWDTMTKMNRFIRGAGLSTISFLYNCAYRVGDFWICASRGWFSDKTAAPSGAEYTKIVARETLRIGMSIKDAARQANALGLPPPTPEQTLVFLHFPPVFGDFLCREILDTLHSYGIRRCYYGHIHGIYDIPPSFDFEGITFTITSADYLHFYPLALS